MVSWILTEEEYNKYVAAQRDLRMLEELEALGVDNWNGYDFLDWSYINTGVREEEA